jgi:flagellum-specific peptidoglycan hydrolase FlgJ
MASPQQIAALKQVFAAAMDAAVLFPQAQACEAMVETSWLTSELGVKYNNLFGTKQHVHPVYGTVNMPTCEFLNKKWVTESDDFVVYPTLAACFDDRMKTLQMLANKYSHYAAALAASTPEEFLTQISMTWATSPTRSSDCISILHAHDEVFV